MCCFGLAIAASLWPANFGARAMMKLTTLGKGLCKLLFWIDKQRMSKDDEDDLLLVVGA